MTDAKAEALRILMMDLEPGDKIQHKYHTFDVQFDGFMDALDVTNGLVITKSETHAVVITPVNVYPLTLPEFWNEFERYDGSRPKD